MKNKKGELKVTYEYVEPKTPQEAEEAERRLQKVFDILLDEVVKNRTAHKGEKA